MKHIPQFWSFSYSYSGAFIHEKLSQNEGERIKKGKNLRSLFSSCSFTRKRRKSQAEQSSETRSERHCEEKVLSIVSLSPLKA
jgi:hypothetical protein